MGKRQKEPEKAPNHERWLITYADLITLLMIFFVVMYTISNVNAKKFAQVASSLSQTLVGSSSGHFIGEAPGPLFIDGNFSAEGQRQEQQEMGEAQKQLEEYIKGQGLEGRVVVELEERGLVVSLKETMLFSIGSAEINPKARDVLSQIGQVLNKMPNNVRIEGHTCDLPIRTASFPSNWELSTARATNVVKFLINNEGLDPKRLSAIGYAENRPLKPNTNEGNRAMNRRVDIVLLRSAFNLAEPYSVDNNTRDSNTKDSNTTDSNTTEASTGLQ